MTRLRVVAKGRRGFKITILPPTVYTLLDCHPQPPPNHPFGLGLRLFFGNESSQG